jgi:hypothetical protein
MELNIYDLQKEYIAFDNNQLLFPEILFNRIDKTKLHINYNIYDDTRANYYCNPIYLLNYHVKVFKNYIHEFKGDYIFNKFFNASELLDILLDNNNLKSYTTRLSNENKLPIEVIINIIYSIKFMNDIHKYLVTENIKFNLFHYFDKTIIIYNNLLILLNEIIIVLSSKDISFTDKINKLIEIRNNNKIDIKQECCLITLFDEVVIRLSKYKSCSIIVNNLSKFRTISKIYNNNLFQLINGKANNYIDKTVAKLIKKCLMRTLEIINTNKDDDLYLPQLINSSLKLIYKFAELLENNEITFKYADEKFRELITDLLSLLNNFEFNEEYYNLILQNDINEALTNDVFLPSNNISETNIDNVIEENNGYYISSWIGI